VKTRVGVASLMIFLACTGAKAQDLANIVGTLTDSSGAVIPAGQVTVSNPERGFVRRVTSDSTGEYTAVRVPIGNYIVTVEKTGFEKLVRSGITLQVGQTLRVDLQLQVGSAATEVVVTANVAHVETENGAISDVVTSAQVSELNLNARNFSNLALLVTGAASLGSGYDPTSVGPNAAAAIAFNGLPVNIQNWEIDGTNNVDQGSGSGSMMVYPSIDSIAEFRVSTANYSAEYAKSGGAQIYLSSSGTMISMRITGSSIAPSNPTAAPPPEPRSNETIMDSHWAGRSSSRGTTIRARTKPSFSSRRSGVRTARALFSTRMCRPF